MPHGAIELRGPDSPSAAEVKDLSGRAGVPVVVVAEPALVLEHTYGGKLMTDTVGGVVFSCTSGFTVRDAVSQLTGVTTAGHCFAGAGDATYTESPTISYPADFSGARWDANQDFAWYQTSHPELPSFNTGLGMRTQSGTQPRLEMEGNPVCHYGIGSDSIAGHSGYSCGVVADIHFAPASNICNGLVCDAVWVRVTDSGTPGGAYDIECRGGDSGGPYFFGTVAWGTHTAGKHSTTDPTSPCEYTVMFSIGGLQWDGVNTRVLLP